MHDIGYTPRPSLGLIKKTTLGGDFLFLRLYVHGYLELKKYIAEATSWVVCDNRISRQQHRPSRKKTDFEKKT